MIDEFKNRREAGRRLAAALVRLKLKDPVVLALPRGGVPVAAEVARALRAPLDVLIVRKIGAPGEPELAVGAIAEGDPPVLVVDERTSRQTDTDSAYIEREAKALDAQIEQRGAAYRRGRARLDIAGKTASIVDEGIATGATMRAAVQALRRMRPARLVLAAPVAAADTVAELVLWADDVVCSSQPAFFGSVGMHYEDFGQLDDAEVIALLDANLKPA